MSPEQSTMSQSSPQGPKRQISLDEIYNEDPLFKIRYRKGSPGTEMLLRHGVITETDLED